MLINYRTSSQRSYAECSTVIGTLSVTSSYCVKNKWLSQDFSPEIRVSLPDDVEYVYM